MKSLSAEREKKLPSKAFWGSFLNSYTSKMDLKMKEKEGVGHQKQKVTCSLERNPRMMAWLLPLREVCLNESRKSK